MSIDYRDFKKTVNRNEYTFQYLIIYIDDSGDLNKSETFDTLREAQEYLSTTDDTMGQAFIVEGQIVDDRR